LYIIGFEHKSGQASPESKLRAAPQDKIIPSLQKSPPFVPHGLHGLFAGFRTIHPNVVFFLSHFLHSTHDLAYFFFSYLKKINKPIHPQSKKRHQVLQPPPPYLICARKKQPKAIIHNT